MKHDEILSQLVANAENNSNVLGFFVFGSVAAGTHRESSDIDVFTVLQSNKPESGMDNTFVDSIKVGDLYLTYEIFTHSVENVPYLLHPIEDAKLLFDREGTVTPLVETIRTYFASHPEITAEWDKYYQLLKEEKAQFGYEKTTIVDVWNDLERRYSGGKTKRRFFNAFYMTNPLVFSLLKKLMQDQHLTKQALDAGDSAAVSSSLLRLCPFLAGRFRASGPSAAGASVARLSN